MSTMSDYKQGDWSCLGHFIFLYWEAIKHETYRMVQNQLGNVLIFVVLVFQFWMFIMEFKYCTTSSIVSKYDTILLFLPK